MALTDKGHFIIGSTEFVAKSITPSFDSLASEDSGRTDDGVMHITWIKTNLHKWEITLPPCDAATVSSLISLVQGKDYYITIFDIGSNAEITKHCYTSSAKGEFYNGVIRNGLFQDVTFSAIEMGD